jgi:hypothetical protein
MNPKAKRTECMYFQLSLSKALERSSFMSIPGVRGSLERVDDFMHQNYVVHDVSPLHIT